MMAKFVVGDYNECPLLMSNPTVSNDVSQTGKNTSVTEALSKVPEVTFVFWLIKIAATTLGETGGDAVSMSMNLGYLVGTAIFATIFIISVVIQIKAKRFHPMIYWFTIIATTTVGTTLADFADRSLGIGYAGGSSLLFVLLMGSLAVWYVLLDYHHVFPNPGNCLGRLDRRYSRAWLRWKRSHILRSFGCRSRALLLDAYFPHISLLGCIYLDPASRRRGGRFSG
jgi:repeat uncharacterized protein DUF347